MYLLDLIILHQLIQKLHFHLRIYVYLYHNNINMDT
nr:MAG TPA: hypothetical protein [Caudoviricetes sp.]